MPTHKIVYCTNAEILQLDIYACQLDGEIHVKNLLFNAFSIGYNSLHSRISCHLLTHRNYLKTTFLFSKKKVSSPKRDITVHFKFLKPDD